MNKMTKMIAILGVVAVALAVATPALANCSPNKQASTFGNGGSAYWFTPAGADTTSTFRFWQVGNRAAGNEGSCPVDVPGMFYFYAPANGWALNATLGDACVAACPTGTLATVAQVLSNDSTKAYFLAATVAEVSGPPVDFAYENLGNQNLLEIPRPAVTSSARVGTVVNVDVTIPAVNTGSAGPTNIITGVELVEALGTADPGRNAGAWTLKASGAASGASFLAQALDCSAVTSDRWLATRIVFGDGVKSDYVGAATRVNCNPALADPGKFKLIDKQKKNR